MSEKQYQVKRYVSHPEQSGDAVMSGPFTFAEAMGEIDSWRSTGASTALCNADGAIIPEADWPADELERFAAQKLQQRERK